MYKEILRSIEGVSIYPVVSLMIFFAVFLAMLIYVFAIKKEHIEKMRQMPFDDGVDGDKEITRL